MTSVGYFCAKYEESCCARSAFTAKILNLLVKTIF